jgi:3',5'-cyclic AMP phosphodiesterase CpdA
MATGRLGAEQLQRLGRLLDHARELGLFRVVLIHHPPISKPSRRFKRLLDGDAFRAELARHGAELVLHGHDHEHAMMWLAGAQGRVPAIGVPSASEAPPGEHDSAGYNLYRIDGGPGCWQCEAISRGLDSDGAHVVQRTHKVLAGNDAGDRNSQ